MNEKFYSLPEEKQLAIINAGYRIFSQNSYKKSPVGEIAAAAGISKSLLFHYFHNKKELYLFLLDYAMKTTITYLVNYRCYDENDIFEMMSRGLKAKIGMMKKYPHITEFSIKAYYETDPDIYNEILNVIGKTATFKANHELFKLDPEKFIPGIDLQMMYNDMYLASEGYLWEQARHGVLNVDKVEEDFSKMIEFWKSIYLRKKEDI